MHVITRRELRGAEVVARDLCLWLAQRGHAVCLVGLFQPPDAAAADQLTCGVPDVIDLGGPQHRGFDLSIARRLRRAIATFRPDVVQANAFNALKFAAVVRWATAARWALVYRNVGLASQWISRPGQRLWGRFLLRQVCQVLSVSEASRDDFATTYGVDPLRIRVLRQGVSVPSPETRQHGRWGLRERVPGVSNGPLLIHVGSFTPEKNHIGLISAFREIHQQCPASHLFLVGDGPLRTAVEAAVREQSLAAAVHFLGVCSDAATLIAGADLMLLTSLVEGIPGVVLEAGAAGVPVVATRIGGLPEIVQDGVTGLLVSPGDMKALASEACGLLENRVRMRQMGASAREQVLERHSLTASIDDLESLYRGLIGADTRDDS